jgi:hypothetical protein
VLLRYGSVSEHRLEAEWAAENLSSIVIFVMWERVATLVVKEGGWDACCRESYPSDQVVSPGIAWGEDVVDWSAGKVRIARGVPVLGKGCGVACVARVARTSQAICMD